MQQQIRIEKECPVFIAGAKRGGTTLLRRIIDSHSAISIPPPGWFYHYIYPYLYSYGDLARSENILELTQDCLDLPIVKKYWNIDETPEQIVSLLPEKSFRGILSTLSRIYAKKKQAASIWGSKAPGDAFWIREVQKDFPSARFVFIYRDGRDVSKDLKEVNWGPNNIFSACMVWKRHMESIRAAKKALKAGSFHEIYYEALVQNPDEVVKGIFDFLKLEYEPAVLDFHSNATDHFMTSSSYHAKTNQPITDEYVGIYKKLPLFERQAQIEAIGPLLREFGYTIEDEHREVGFWEQIRNAEEDDHGGLVLKGGVEFLHRLKQKRAEKLSRGIWTMDDKKQFIHKTS
jgi:hypothetical protein